jgi:DNA-binding transcriptional MerR regulator
MMPSGLAPGFSVAEAARRVGVAASTLRTWERRYGVQPSVRTSGGHRRYTVEDVAGLQRLRRLIDSGMPTGAAAARMHDGADVRPGRAPEASGSQWALRFQAAVQSLDHAEATRLAARALTRLSVVKAWNEVFVPHLQAIGDYWAGTGEGVEREHLAAAAIQFALLRHTVNHSSPNGPARVLAVATPDEGHTLPLDALAAAAADAGVSTCVLGTLPKTALLAALDDLAPSVVVVWARSRDTSDGPLLRSVGRRVPVVCAAGPGWQPRRLPRGITHVDDLEGALAAVRAWVS